MFTAGTDTTTSTIEWAMAELLHNPKALKKVQMELRSKIGPDRNMEEKDIENLPYLQAVIKETLRLHPPLPHMAMYSCNMLGYNIPQGSFISFGSGRRMCPAMPLASRVLPPPIGSLLCSFDWVLPDGENQRRWTPQRKWE